MKPSTNYRLPEILGDRLQTLLNRLQPSARLTAVMAALLDEAITQIESQTPPMAPLPTIASLRQQLYKVDAATFLGQVTNRIDAMVDERIEQALTKRLGDAAEQFVAAKKKKAARKDAA